MNIKEIIGAVIESKHGWAVGEQFVSTWDGEDFEKQNTNALIYIEKTIKSLIGEDIFSEDTEAELVGYLLGLEEYLTM